MTLKSIRKILSITLSAIFFLQQSGFVFASVNVSTWADLQAGIAGTPEEYNVTTALTADDSPNGTLAITADGYSVTGAALTENGTHDPLVNIANAITFGLGNNISGSIVNNGVLNYSGSSLANGAVTGNGTFNFLGVTVANGNTINQSAVSVDAATTLTNNAAITATTFENNGVVDNNAAITGAITNQGTLTSTATNLIGAVENKSTLNLEGGTVQAAISGSGNTNITGNLSSDYAIEQTNVAISNNAYVTQNATLTAAVSNASGSTLEIAPDNLAGAVDNAGTLKFNAGGSLAQDITGTGLTRFDGSSAIVLDDANSIAQDTIKVGTSATFTANASNLSATTEIFNDGQLNLTGGTNANAINGDGSLYITTADVTNEQSITQTALTATTGNLINNDTVVVTNLATESTGSITNNDSITVAEAVTNLGVITNKTGATLDNSASTGVFTNSGTVNNDGTINTVNFTNNGNVSGNGTTNITGDSFNAGTITQGLVTIDNNATFTNNGLLAANVSNASGSTLNSDPDNLGGNVANDGTLNLNAAGTLTIDVTGVGETNILGDLENKGSITQDDININSGVVVTTNASDMTAANDIANEGIINYTGGTTNNTITGAGRVDITGYVTNTGDITQNNVSNSGIFTNNGSVTANLTNTNTIEGNGSITTGTGVSSNTGIITQDALTNNGTFDNAGHIIVNTLTNNTNAIFNTNADLLTTANDSIVNNGALHFTGGDNKNEITGTGMTYIDGNVQNLADIYTKVQVNTGAHYGTATDVHAKIDNRGITDLIDADILSEGKISGTGTTNILGDTLNSGSITQSSLNISSGGSLTTNSQNVVAAVSNDGELIWNAGDSNTNAVSGSGTLEITGGNIVNTATITQDNVYINTGSLTSNADLLTVAGGIENAADLTLAGGVNKNVITGTGDMTTTGDFTNKADIEQDTLTNNGNFLNYEGSINADITNSGTFINEDGLITGDITNNSTGVFATAGDDVIGDITNDGTFIITDGDNTNDITGTGDLQIEGTTINNGDITQDNIFIASGAKLVASDIGDIATTTGIDNDGTLELQAGLNTNTITGNTGSLAITGIVANNSGVSISQDNIDIATLAIFQAAASDLTTVNGITNSGNLILSDGTNNNNNNNISGNGNLLVVGTVNNAKNISQNALTNVGTLTSNADLLAFANGIKNDNILNITGGTNANVITESSAGTTNFTNDVVNNAAITQTNVTNDTGTLTNNAAITADFANNGGTVENNAAITGAITNTGTINSVADNLVGTVASNGTLNIAGGTVQDTISGTGVMNITDDLVNAQSITQTTVNNSANMENSGAITAAFNNSGVVNNSAAITGAITNDGTINSTADNLVGAIANDGTLNIAGGTIQNTISGNGEMNITADLVNDYTINQSFVYNEGNLTNNNTITADDITNSGVITGKASYLVASNEIANEGTLVFNSASTGASVISGAGDIQVTADTTLTANNTYTGETLIDGATLTIAGQNQVSADSDVLFANNGLLHVSAAASLDNLLKGQAATDDINVQNDAALTLSTAMGEAADFHKSGAGVMTFAMDSNGYTGDTYVDAGTLIGNTLNINNTVNGAAGTIVNFNDTANAELNAINTSGTFVKSGSALLNVETKAFTAAQADINSGIFAANRAITANVLNVNDGATLRGNGNITGTVNVNNGGTIAPGNSIDTLTITGDVNFASGSTTAIEINETPASDKLVITGNANIASGANLTVSNENGRYFDWDSFEIVNAGAVSGTFTYDGTITDYDASRINVELDYSDPTKVLLTAKRKATDYSGTTAGLSRNQSEAAKAIDAVSTGFGGDITNALLQIEKLGGLNPEDVTLINPNATLQTALDDVAGALYSNSALATLFNAKTAHVYDRIAKRSPSAGACPNCHDNVWVEYYSQYDKVYSDANSPHFTNNMTGVLAGYDRSSEDVLLGVYAGFSKGDMRQNGGSRMDLDDTSLGVYGGYRTGDWLFKGTLFSGVQHYNAKRVIAFMGRTANGSYDGVNLGLDLEGSYSIPVYNWLTVRPFIGWLNNYSHQNAFTENGADDLNLHVFGNDQFNSQVRLGVQLEGKVKNRLSWYGSAAVKQFVGNDYAKLHMNLDVLPNTDMQIISAELGRTYFSGQAGLTYAINNNWSIFGNLDTGLSNKSTNCYGNIGLAYTW